MLLCINLFLYLHYPKMTQKQHPKRKLLILFEIDHHRNQNESEKSGNQLQFLLKILQNLQNLLFGTIINSESDNIMNLLTEQDSISISIVSKQTKNLKIKFR